MLQMLKEANRAAFNTFFGTALIKFASGLIGIWGTINIYFLSYLKNNGSEVTAITNSVIILSIVVPSALAMLASTALSRRFGYRKVIQVCGVIFALSPYLINFRLNTVTLIVFYLTIPVSCISIASVPVLNCLWAQFPNHLNKVSGLAVLFFALGSIAFNLIFTFLINPDNQEAAI
jgi:MFS family permease